MWCRKRSGIVHQLSSSAAYSERLYKCVNTAVEMFCGLKAFHMEVLMFLQSVVFSGCIRVSSHRYSDATWHAIAVLL